MEWIIAHLSALAGGYIVTKVSGILGQSLWGRIVLAVAKRRLGRETSAAESALNALQKIRPLTSDELDKLTPQQRDAINHVAK